MKLSHIHENKTPFPSVGKTLADYLNSNRIYPLASPARRPSHHFNIKLKIHGFTDRPISLTKNGPFKLAKAISGGIAAGAVGYELVEYELIPELDNPLDNTRDEFGEDFAMFAAVVEGINKFEGQFAWYNEDLISNEQIWPSAEMRRGLCWEEGRLPKLPRQYKR